MDNTVVDIHCHMFNASDLPIRGFVKYVGLHGDPVSGPLADLADWILSSGTVSYADLCRARHKSAYAESRVMPTELLEYLPGGQVVVLGAA